MENELGRLLVPFSNASAIHPYNSPVVIARQSVLVGNHVGEQGAPKFPNGMVSGSVFSGLVGVAVDFGAVDLGRVFVVIVLEEIHHVKLHKCHGTPWAGGLRS